MLGLVTMALVVISLASSTLLNRYLVARVDNQLKASTSSIAQTVLRGDFSPDTLARANPTTSYFFEVVSSDGQLFPVSVNRYGAQPLSPPRMPSLTDNFVAQNSGRSFTVDSQSGGMHWRVFLLDLPGEASLAVAVPLDDVASTVNRLIAIDAIAGFIVLITLAIVGYFMIRSSLRRLVEVEHTAKAIAAGDLSRRVMVTDPYTEVGRLGTSLNTMLGQIEYAFHAQEQSEMQARASEERMRRFVADAGHELRTPLTSVRGFAELYRMGAVSDPAELSRLMKRIEDEARRMGLLVEDLLLLARLDQQRPLERRPVDLLSLASDAVADLHALHPERTLRLVHDGASEPPVVIGDEGRLRQVLGNLLANAFAHTPDGTTVTVALGVEAGTYASLAVADNGPGLRPEDAARVFERFFRADPSRVRQTGGSGLGLSIVSALVAAHDGTVEVDSALGVGTTFTVRLPLASPFADEPPTNPAIPVTVTR